MDGAREEQALLLSAGEALAGGDDAGDGAGEEAAVERRERDVEAGLQLQQRGLAAAARADDGGHFSPRDREVE